ncbi:MAG: 2-amino-4-ketopentanoate thiolase [Clostridia bacterium]|nr:2-amino-4-ketopentanoate thiolase [Clostridia bacterium]
MVKKGEWVRIHAVVLEPSDRSPKVPDDTKGVPLELWTKGFLMEDAEMGAEVSVETVTGRIATGELIEVNPYYTHSYGKFVPELIQIDKQLRSIMYGGDK